MKIITEKKAFEKACPFASVAVTMSGNDEIMISNLNTEDGINVGLCCAGACMAWQYVENGKEDTDEATGWCNLIPTTHKYTHVEQADDQES